MLAQGVSRFALFGTQWGLGTATVIPATFVIPAKAGIQRGWAYGLKSECVV